MDIFKIVVNEAGTLDRYVDGQIFHNKNAAIMYAEEIGKEGWWDEKEIDAVSVYQETPSEGGKFRTTGEVYRITF